jgi:phosphomannomutase
MILNGCAGSTSGRCGADVSSDEPLPDGPRADGRIPKGPVPKDPVPKDPVTQDPAAEDPAPGDPIPADLRARVEAWAADDPDPRDQAELLGLLEAGSVAAAELADRFAASLQFGTAGLRGVIGAGPNRMNRAVVRSATAAVARWLRGRDPGAAQAGVVIGCDARHRSDEFADEAATVLAGAGIRAHLLPPQRPTPLLAFAVRHLSAAAGIMITASHNPPADNGYKLYLDDGAQIVPPADAEIEARIEAARVDALSDIPVAPRDSPLVVRHGDEVAAAYLDAITATPTARAGTAGAPAPPLRVVYTPLHGVALGLATQAIKRAGFPAPHVVAAQARPDPDFPTVAFPNPEQPGALDLALADARRYGADLVLANDPDGDRLAVAVPDGTAAGGWRVLTGDQLGALLGGYVLERTAHEPDPDARIVVSTIVSSTLLSRIAVAAGARYAATLTGFKWIVRGGERQPGSRFVFGYEEALGYVVGDVVRDKDGIGAALAVLGLASTTRSAGSSLLDRYDAIETAHGVHMTAQLTLRTRVAAAVMARLRSAPPAALGGAAVTSTLDLAAGGSGLPPADLLVYRLSGARLVVRPSGTEPKLKAYLEVVEPVTDRDLTAARTAAAARLGPLKDAVGDLLGS